LKYILILEDDADLAAGMEMALMSDDFSFTICSTIKEAEEKFRQQTFDLLILDVNLPDGSGFELCRKIRKSSKVSIILLTARDMELDIVRGLECGADDYITKPFSTMVLRARIRALLRRTAPEQETDYAQGPFRFQFATMEFLKNGIPVDLSRTEQRILYLLVFHPGQILTRERLMEWVWPDGTEYVEDNALSVGIRRLRDKLEDNPSKPEHIKTVYGKGYQWENSL
jgi:DNA-binding response OmpR family regulator